MSYVVDNVETGCVVDGIHGVYTGQLLCNYAEAHGWVSLFGWDESQDAELRQFTEDSALDFLNERVAKKGYLFGWFEGNVMYWSDVDWEIV